MLHDAASNANADALVNRRRGWVSLARLLRCIKGKVSCLIKARSRGGGGLQFIHTSPVRLDADGAEMLQLCSTSGNECALVLRGRRLVCVGVWLHCAGRVSSHGRRILAVERSAIGMVRMDAVIAVSPESASDLKVPCTVISHGVENSKFHPSLEARLAVLMAAPEATISMGIAAHRHVLAGFSIERESAAIGAVYDGLWQQSLSLPPQPPCHTPLSASAY